MKQPVSRYSALVTLRIRDNLDVSRVLRRLSDLQALSLEESGCRRFDLFLVSTDSRRVILIEEFDDDAAFSSHLQASYTQEYFSLNMTEVVDNTRISELCANVLD